MATANLSLLLTDLSWADLLLGKAALKKIEAIKNWLKQNANEGVNTTSKTGCRIFLSGQSNLDKTLTTELLGKEFHKPVYKIDLSKVVSKYIGETEKNLEQIFAKAEDKNWILFFDEATALFGKRSNVKDAHDRYANVEVNYLLQRMEEYSGLAILASNVKGNIDKAFIRRFHFVINFPVPTPAERLRLWQNSFTESVTLADDVDLLFVAKKYLLSRGNIQLITKQIKATIKEGEKITANLLLTVIESFYTTIGTN
jgi:SpoVK/Ycf46/Vps4 family AAA+-type ATPase